MIRRKQYARYWLDRMPARPTAQFDHGRGSKYMPHQGAKEKARRMKNVVITFNTGA